MQTIILVYPSVNQVLNVEDILDEKDFIFDLIPVPKAVNPNCGLAISFLADHNRINLIGAIEKANMAQSALVYLRKGDDFTFVSDCLDKDLLDKALVA